MCDTDRANDEKSFSIDKGKSSRAVCKICKKKCLLGEIRIAKYIPDFVGNGRKKNYHHVDCIFKQFLKQRLSTKRIRCSEDLDGWEDLSVLDQKMMDNKIKRSEEDVSKRNKKCNFKKLKKTKMKKDMSRRKEITKKKCDNTSSKSVSFKNFCDLANEVINRSGNIEKFCTIAKIFKESNNIGIVTKNDLKLFCKLLFWDLESKTINLQTKQLAKIFAKLFSMDHNEIIKDSEIMNLSDSISFHFTQSKKFKPANVNSITLTEVDEFLSNLCSTLMEEEDYIKNFGRIVCKCTVDELKILIHLIQNDFDIDACLKYILEVIHPDAYQLFQKRKMFDTIIDEYINMCDTTNVANTKLSPMTIVLPALAENCRSVEQAFLKYPKGAFCDVNYEGERVHFHKKNSDFKYYSYSFQQGGSVEKITNLKNLIFEAFPYANKLILDCEILPFNTRTGDLLPPYKPGTLPTDADLKHIVYCVVVFDCMFFDVDISRKPLRERRDILKRNMIQIPNLLILSQAKEVHCEEDLNELVARMLKLNVDGLMLKDIEGTYAPSKVQWLKIKRNSFTDDNTAVTIDLIILGGWRDPKNEDDMLTIFLMGCFDKEKQRFCTVAKVYIDKGDAFFENSPEKMNMTRIGCDDTKVPDWLCCVKDMVPEFIAADPKSQPVWKITGLELIKGDTHSSGGISLRFPQVTCTESGKNWRQVIDLTTLKKLYEETKIDVLSITKTDSSSPKNSVKAKSLVKTRKNQKVKRKIKNTSAANSKKKLKKDQNLANREEASDSNVEKITSPNYFENIFLLLDEQVRNRHTQWIRSFVANGGTLVHDCHRHSATHVLHLYDEEPLEKMYRLQNVIHVIVEWIKDTLKEGALQDDRPYRVRLISKEGIEGNDEDAWKDEKRGNLEICAL